MEILYERICGVDVHQSSLVCCLVQGLGSKPQTLFHSFGTMTVHVEALIAWLREHRVRHVVMEATGIYWKPFYALLEPHVDQIIVANPLHVKAIGGRKTDKKDAQWLAELARVGLVRSSFVPDAQMRQLRELVRYRTATVRDHVDLRNRILRTLEWSNLKLASVLSDVFGTSGRRLLDALVVGQQSPEEMAQLVDRNVRAPRAEIAQALRGQLCEQTRWILQQQVEQLHSLDAALVAVDQRIAAFTAQQESWREAKALLMTIPGICAATAHVILGEFGADVKGFASSESAAAWAGLCPGHNESAGKKLGAAPRKGNPHLKTILCQAAKGAARTKGTVFKAKYAQLCRRQGPAAATVALAHKLLRVVFAILKTRQPYQEPTKEPLPPGKVRARIKKALHELAHLGFQFPAPLTA